LSLLLFIGFIAFVQPVHATTYSPIVVEPYDDESLRIISSSLGAFKSNFDRVKDDKAVLISAFQQNKVNPTPENTANVTEKAGQMLYTSVEFVKNGQESIDRAIPELRKYRKYLQKVSASMEGDDPLLSDRAKQVELEAEKIVKLLTDLEKAEKDLKLIKSDLVMLTRAWLHSEQIQRELRKSFGGGKIGSIHKELSGVVDTLSEVRGIITDLLSENSLGCSSEEYAEGVEQYRTSVRNYFRGTRR
jgi:hypothetical protein